MKLAAAVPVSASSTKRLLQVQEKGVIQGTQLPSLVHIPSPAAANEVHPTNTSRPPLSLAGVFSVKTSYERKWRGAPVPAVRTPVLTRWTASQSTGEKNTSQ